MQDRLYELENYLASLYCEKDHMFNYRELFDEVDFANIDDEIQLCLNEMQELEFGIELLLDGNID